MFGWLEGVLFIVGNFLWEDVVFVIILLFRGVNLFF